MPTDKPAPLSLTDDASAPPAGPTGDGVPPTTPMYEPAQILENLKTFTDSTHQKAAQVVTWLGNVEGMTGERANKLLYNIIRVLPYFFDLWVPIFKNQLQQISGYLRFIKDMKTVLDQFDSSFQQLAEAQHSVESQTESPEKLLICIHWF